MKSRATLNISSRHKRQKQVQSLGKEIIPWHIWAHGGNWEVETHAPSIEKRVRNIQIAHLGEPLPLVQT